MRAVALRFEGPLQSWGGSALGEVRPTHEAPTASGVIGLVGAALGVDRVTGVRVLSSLHRALALCVRVERRGQLLVDYHTALGVPDEKGKPRTSADITYRRYLADASFAAVLVEVDAAAMAPITLDDIAQAVRRPRYVLSLGRRACVPAVPVLASRDVIEGADWEALLAQVPPTDAGRVDQDAGEVWVDARLVVNAPPRAAVRWHDAVIGPLPRMFGDRTVLRIRPTREPSAHPAETGDTTKGFLS